MGEPKFPSGGNWPVGGIAPTVDELRQRLPVEFFDDLDDLDYFTAGWLMSRAVGPILLIRYKRSPDPHVEVLVDSLVCRDDAIRALGVEFGIDDAEWKWTAKHQTYADSLAEAERLTREARGA